MAKVKSQQLLASNLVPDPADELACRVKDPLWYLARQWQTGEFQAENGGSPAFITVTKSDNPLTHATVGQRIQLDLAQPLEMVAEAESNGDAPGWQESALEYEFDVESARHELTAEEYRGRGLDWWHFDLEATKANAGAKTSIERMVPTMLHFKGAPHPRWWRFEDGDASLDVPIDPEPNVLSTLLPEFFYTDIDNWFVFPLPMESGAVREIKKLTVVDAFGIATEMSPAYNSGDGKDAWRLFTLTDKSESGAATDGSLFFAPHIAGDVLDNDLVEDVRFLRDDDANLVWAVEAQYTDDAGNSVFNGDKGRIENAVDAIEVPPDFDGAFRLQSETPAYWIPYVARYAKSGLGAPDGDTYLRRGRTIEASNAADPQFKAKITSETVRLNEEEIASVGLRVRRINRYARGADGTGYHWVGRIKDTTDPHVSHAGLKFDFVTKRTT